MSSIPPIDANAPRRIATATFALGWFWGPDSRFGSIPGVVRTRAGYAGGTMSHPTYTNLGAHSEAIQLDFDPQTISYADLLAVFWESHSPVRQSYRRQYAHIAFYHDDAQHRAIQESKAQQAARHDRPIVTEIVPYRAFWLAEDYHQKYMLRQHPSLLREFSAMYPDLYDFVNSTAVTRANGYAGGYGTLDGLHAEIDSLGLSQAGQDALLATRRK